MRGGADAQHDEQNDVMEKAKHTPMLQRSLTFLALHSHTRGLRKESKLVADLKAHNASELKAGCTNIQVEHKAASSKPCPPYSSTGAPHQHTSLCRRRPLPTDRGDERPCASAREQNDRPLDRSQKSTFSKGNDGS